MSVGCHNDCNGRGKCRRDKETWRCQCDVDWGGEACAVERELSCSDGVDNDNGKLSITPSLMLLLLLLLMLPQAS